MMNWIICGLFLAISATIAPAQDSKPAAKPLYECDFEKAELDKVPDDMMVLDGVWAVKARDGNKLLELPGAPLDSFGVLFGPAQKENVWVTGRVFGTAKGRRQPTFGVGLGGVGGFRLLVAPGKAAIEIWRGDELVTSASHSWQTAAWTQIKLQLRKVKDGEWAVEGKAWKDGTPEPQGWQISHVEKAEPAQGRAAVWGSPHSGTPIQFDDLKVGTAK